MEALSTLQKTLLRVGVLVAIVTILWMFGLLRMGAPVAH
jgi:hypothetical protein